MHGRVSAIVRPALGFSLDAHRPRDCLPSGLQPRLVRQRLHVVLQAGDRAGLCENPALLPVPRAEDARGATRQPGAKSATL